MITNTAYKRDTLRFRDTSAKGQIGREDQGRMLGGRFAIEAALKQCESGTIYRAKDIVLDRTVAIKWLPTERAEVEGDLSRFIEQARTAARITHPNFVTIYDIVTQAQNGAYVVMEFINGQSLRDVLNSLGMLSPLMACSLMARVTSAVAAAHKEGIVHRDLKPEKILLKKNEKGGMIVKVASPSIAKMRVTVNITASQLTAKCVMMGTPQYMSPEQCWSNKIDGRSDIYSLGTIFYELLTGAPPFTGTSSEVIRKHLCQPAAGFWHKNPAITSELETLVLSMLRKTPTSRPTINEVLNTVKDIEASYQADHQVDGEKVEAQQFFF